MRDGYKVMVTANAMTIIGDPATATKTKRAVERAIVSAFEGVYPRSRTVVFHESPLAVHIDPERKLVLVITNEFGFPLVDGELVEALLPYCSEVALA